MKRLSTTARTCLVLAGLAAATAYAATADWPLKRDIDLSSGFGDYRPRRFHAGVDLRTGGRIGADLVAPVSGHIMRLRTSYDGYGKVIYLKGDDGYVYVFAHLDSFNDTIDRTVREAQVAAKRYYTDISLPPDSIRVKKGEVLGKTGKTGTGAPHLHLEKRTADNVPINPLRNGFSLKDNVRPTFERVGFVLKDDRGIFADGSRRMFVNVVPSGKKGRFTIAEKLHFNRPFGLLADCYDQMREAGMRQSIYSLELSIDDRPYYRIVLDTLQFESGPMSDLEFDNVAVANDSKRVRRLYQEPGNEVRISRALAGDDGVVGANDGLTIGRHRAKIVGVDAFGNSSELSFDFVWGPKEGVCAVDSTVETGLNSLDAYVGVSAAMKAIGADSIDLQMFDGKDWGVPDSLVRTKLDDGRYRYAIHSSKRLAQTILRLVALTDDGFAIADEPFYGISSYAYTKIGILPEVTEDGLLVRLVAPTVRAGAARLELYNGDSLLGTEYPTRFTNTKEYLFFVPPEPQYAHITKMRGALSQEPGSPTDGIIDVDIRLVGLHRTERVTSDSLLTLNLGREYFYSPLFVQVQHLDTLPTGDLNSDVYDIKPQVFLTRKDFPMEVKIRSINQVNDKTGLCWYDPEKSEWVWLTDSEWHNNDRLVTASSAGGGRFAALYDLEAPLIYRVNIKPGMTYYNRRPEIRFEIVDNLSGIADDRAIDIRLDNRWMIPEYDPESKVCKTQPLEDLTDGAHHVAITVFDRAGNKAEHYFQFFVKDRNPK
ncbi:M23 family metallopeptidase [bacterium]|nr:M23 family metallopeptidase [bacterium]